MGRSLAIDVIVPRERPRRWQEELLRRLAAEGHHLAVLHDPAAPPWPASANALIAFERLLLKRPAAGLAAPLGGIAERRRQRPPDLCLDLAGNAPTRPVPTVGLRFDRGGSDLAVAAMIAEGGLPTLEAVLDGQVVISRALPMIDRREAASLGIDDVLARAVTLLAAAVRIFAEGRLVCDGTPLAKDGGTGFAAAYFTCALPRLAREAVRRALFRQAHWRVGYRFRTGAGIAEEGRIGTGWRVLPDAGDRFYADPFPFHWQGRPYLFVEDYDHAAGKAVISVAPFDAEGRALTPRAVLEEPHHLSYPQVFARDGAVWMLPEASASGRLTLYRAMEFPDRWAAEAVLLEGEVSDATLLDHGGRLWLFATVRDGFGSTSDTMAVFSAPSLAGPWLAHPRNPVVIDRRRARPGGAFHRDAAGRLFLPLQDGTLGYGGGLGLSELLALDEETIRLADPRPIRADGDWPYPRLHTLNRSGPLEVIDGIAAVPKFWSSRRS